MVDLLQSAGASLLGLAKSISYSEFNVLSRYINHAFFFSFVGVLMIRRVQSRRYVNIAQTAGDKKRDFFKKILLLYHFRERLRPAVALNPEM